MRFDIRLTRPAKGANGLMTLEGLYNGRFELEIVWMAYPGVVNDVRLENPTWSRNTFGMKFR